MLICVPGKGVGSVTW